MLYLSHMIQRIVQSGSFHMKFIEPAVKNVEQQHQMIQHAMFLRKEFELLHKKTNKMLRRKQKCRSAVQ